MRPEKRVSVCGAGMEGQGAGRGFTFRAMKRTGLLLGLAIAAIRPSSAAELKPETLRAWNQYVHMAEARMQARLESGRQFLWTDEEPTRGVRVRRGEILAAPLEAAGIQPVPGGLIHHWIGALFVPNARLADVLAVVHDYARYKEIYRPRVLDSRLLACADGRQEYSMIWMNNVLFENVALETRYEAGDFAVDQRRWFTITHVVSAREIEGYAQRNQRILPPGEGSGFIWRLQSIARYEERDEGVYVELEAIALTHDIPAGLRWLASPLVTRLSRGALAASLRQTREGVALSIAAKPGIPLSNTAAASGYSAREARR
jgi:hypothetical protein